MIDDPELRNLFRAESEEHLQTLEAGLLRLESQPNDTAALEQLFRSAHSLKGAARMLGVERLETLAHHFEDELGAARHGRRAMSSVAADRLYQGLDAMRRLALEACGGEDARVDITEVLARLRGERPPGMSVSETVPTEDLKEIVAPEDMKSVSEVVIAEPDRILPVELLPQDAGAADATPTPEFARFAPSEAHGGSLAGPQVVPPGQQASAFKIETIRVEPRTLDALMTLAGEMAVSTARAMKALSVIGELVDLWDEEQRSGGSAPTAHAHSNRHTERMGQISNLLARLERTGDEEVGRLGLVADELVESIRDLRLLPFTTIFNLFPRMVRDLSREQGKEVRLEVVGGAVSGDKHLLEEMKDPLMHLIRNAIDHAIEGPDERVASGKPREATIRLKAWRTATRVVIEVGDDGRGLNEKAIGDTAVRKHLLTEHAVAELSPEAINGLIFTSGFSTTALITDVSGRGVGLDVVRTTVERLKGTISVESVPGRGCTFRIEAPISLATTRVLLVRIGKECYAIPMETVDKTFLLSPSAVFSIEGRPVVQWDSEPVCVAPLADLLGLSALRNGGSEVSDSDQPGVLLIVGSDRIGLFVDELLDEQEVIVKPFGGVLERVRHVLGSTILSTGEITMVLNPYDLVKSMRKGPAFAASKPVTLMTERKKVVLLAEDSITTRTQEKRILEAAGYEVVTAVDGADAFVKLGSRAFDAVVSDIEMPNMTGLQLTERIRKESRYKELPIILVTSLATDEDRREGAAVGANAYIAKGTFDQNMLLEALRRLV